MVRQRQALERRALEFVQEHNLIAAGETLVVGVSGGADSVCLLHVLSRWQDELRIKLHIAHINHQLRGAESEADAKYVSDLAHHLGIPATIASRDVAAYRIQRHCSLEEAAREVRYGFLVEVVAAVAASRAAVGHTRDDHIETILMHLLRGSGTAGLRGLQPCSVLGFGEEKTPLKIVRPLLEITRQETASYCQEHQLSPQSDSSNMSLSFYRNRLRLELLPLLRSYNPNIDQALLRLSTIAADEVDFIEEQAGRLWAEVAKEENGTIYLDKRKMAGLPKALQRQLLRLALARFLGSLRDIEAEHIEAMISLVAKPAGKRLSLPGGLVFCGEYDWLALASALSCPLSAIDGEFGLNVPGETVLPGWRVTASILQKWAVTGEDSFTASFDLEKTGSQLIVRKRQRGDRFQPLGMDKLKKLQDFMVDAKIPRSWRDRIPLVCSQQQILWVVGWHIDDRVKVSDATREVLCLKFERLVY